MRTRILNAREVLFSDETTEAILPGEGGELSVWDFHQPCICRLKQGPIQLKFRDKVSGNIKQQSFLIKEGVLRIDFEGMSVLIEEADKKEA